MRPERPRPSLAPKGRSALLWVGKFYGVLAALLLTAPGLLKAQQVSPEQAANEGAMPANTPVNAPQTSDNLQTLDVNAEAAQNPVGTQVQVVPLLAQPNAASTYSTSTFQAQSSQVTSPSLFTTGVYDVSQVATTTALLQAFSPEGPGGYANETYGPIQRIRLGPVDLKFAVTTTVVSDDNILAGEQGTPRLSDTSIAITPAVLLVYGNHEGQKGSATLTYSPTLTRFFQHSDQNTDDQNAAFTAAYPFQRFTLDLSEAYAQTTGVNIDSNLRTTQTSNISAIGGTYDIDEKFSVTSHLQETDITFSGGGGQGDEISALNNAIQYHLSDKLTIGPGANIGLERPDDSRHQVYEQALMNWTYDPTEKIDFYGQAGVEFRQYDGGGDTHDPIFNVGLNYKPTDATVFNVKGFQSVQPSTADSNLTSTASGFGTSITERFFQRYFLAFSFEYDHSEYQTLAGAAPQPVTSATTSGGNQDNFVYRPSLTFAPSEWTSIALYYQYRANESDSTFGGYHDNQLGISVSAQF